MRERERRGGRSTMEVVVMVLAVVVMVVTGGVKDTAATPAVHTAHHHHHHQEEPVGPTSMQANHVEDAYLDNALDDWLNNFETYTFMVKQDLDSHHDEEGAEGGEEAGVEAGTTEEQEEVEDEDQHEREEEWSAPIAVSVGSKSLLDPHLDYLVTVESLVAEEGSIFLTLSKYNNQTGCGVGGFTVEAAMRTPHPPRRAVARGESSSGGGGGGIEEQSNSSTTFIAFDLQHEGNVSLPDTSAWAEVSEDYWWARGRLAGGGMLSITFTPPECGCLALSTYYALPVGNLTLVVGPQAYPDELQALLCIDPLAVAPVQEEYDEEEEAEEEEDVGEYLQEPSALVAPRTTDASEAEAEEEEEAETSPEEPPVVNPRRRKGSRGERRKAKKSRRQMKRQRIRQAGRRQARRQQRLQQRLEEEEGEEGEEGAAADEKRPRRRWKQKRRGKKVWRKIKRGRKGRRRPHGAKHHHLHHEDGNSTSSENTTDHLHHHHPHPHPLHGQNASADTQQEERLINILLRDEPTENSTAEEGHEEQDAPAEEGSTDGEAGVGAEGQEWEVEDDDGAMTPRQRRKNRRQRKKMMRKERRKAHPPGVKFCCKQGVKHKKNILEFNSTSESSPEPCNSTSEVVSTFANHQFGIEVDACDHTYTKCCTGFTAEMWNSIKAKKMARRMERKQRRKSRRRGRKHRRQNERRMRKEMKRQSRHQDEAEEDAEAGAEEQGEGEAVVE